MSSFEKCTDQLKRRRWEHIRGKWLHHIPTFATAGAPPLITVAGVNGFSVLANQLTEAFRAAQEAKKKSGIVRADDKLLSAREELPGMREAIFCESLFLLHKARHVMGAAEFHVRDGIKTWALVDAYQAALFAARSIIGFLGVSFPEYNSRTIAIDLYPDVVTNSNDYNESAFHYVGLRMDHRNVWDVFQRLLGVVNVDHWPRDIVNKLKSIESNKFAAQRNEIHYKNNGWLINDLHQFDINAGFGAVTKWGEGNKDLDFDRNDISLVVAFAVIKLGMSLLMDLEKVSAKLAPDAALFKFCGTTGRHPLYGAELFN